MNNSKLCLKLKRQDIVKLTHLRVITSIGDNLSKWVNVCKLNQLKKGEMFDFDYETKRILLANLDGKIYASDRICTHADADLSTGILTEEGVTCPLHLSTFNLKTGVPENLPAEIPLKIYNVKIEQNEIYIEVD
ncbi:MAG: non-heme iron oxygenase ferredoxin subunit [Thaumarchaeota archaeon]|nr:non-heme iron oxygenase ferredoxin subunit [Nitrososphaerota archaeon]